MKKQSKKLIAPIIITILLVIYLTLYLIVFTSIPIPLFVRIIGIIIAMSLIGVAVYVLIERIKEIRSGDEDDLGKY